MFHHAMRWLLPAILLAAGLLSLGTIPAAGAAGSGVVAAYSFDDGSGSSASDLSGNGNTATLHGATWTTGKYGGAVSFNGTSSLVTVPDSASLDLSSGLTLEAWVRATSFAPSQTLIAKERPGGGFPYGVELDNGVPTGYVSTSAFSGASSASSLPKVTWKFVAVTYDGSTLRVYVDGTQVGSAPASGSIAASSGQLSIGGDSVWGEYFNGRIDNVRIYSRALSATELAADQATPVTAPTPPPTAPTPVAAYAFDEGTGMSAADASGSGNTATLNGATWTSAGKYGAAVSFGASSIVSAADAPSLDPTAGLTLEAWVKPTSFAASQTIVAKERPGGGFPWGLELDNGVPSTYVVAATNAVATAPSALPLGAWSFIAATYDGTTLAVWVNGSVVASTAVSGALTTSTGTLSIGADAAWGERLAGSIDNVRVYGTALSSSQLGTDMSTAIGGSPPPPADTTPPSTPGGLATSNVSQTGLTLSWTASTDNVGVTGYDVYAGGIKAGTTSTTSFAVPGLACGTTYTLAVDAYDAAGNTSTQGTTSAMTSACLGDTTAPTTPGGLATSNVSQTGVTLSWTASTDNVGVTGYDVYAGGSKTGTTSTTSYALTGLSCGTTYTLGVDAYDAAGNTSAAGTVTAQTSACSSGGTGFVKYACTGRSFYVDYAAGSDAGSGTATAAAWKRAPGMNGFAGS